MYILLSQPLYPNLLLPAKEETAVLLTPNNSFAIISHSRAEFIIDLASSLPGSPKAQVVSRVVLAPEHAKRLLLALQENVMRYEKEHGQIPLESAAKPSVPRTANPFGEA